MNLKQKLVLLLSDPDIDDRDFDSVRSWLEQGGIIQCLQDAEGIRLALLGYRGRTSNVRRLPAAVRDPLVSEVDRLLRAEAGMTAQAALAELAVRTRFFGNLPERISFANGVRRISDEVGGSTVLHVAQEIRNERVHETKEPAWPLNRDR